MSSRRVFLLIALCLVPLQFSFSQTSGSGTANYVALWTNSTTLGDSHIFQKAGDTGIGTTSPQWALDVNGHINSSLGYRLGESLVLTMPGGSTLGNIALGSQAFLDNTVGSQNTAVGTSALQFNTGGSANTATGYKAMAGNISGLNNTATGALALEANTSGQDNTADGMIALGYNTTGTENTACGAAALEFNTTGSNNTASGSHTLTYGTAGSNNTAIGWGALERTTASGNTAAGYLALINNSSGANNIAIGVSAANNVAGVNSNNIHIGSAGSSADSGVIRIGTIGTQTSFFAAGVFGASSGSSSAVPVLIDSNGQLVTVSSSRRFKTDIQDMGDASGDLMRLRPVTFRYRKPLADGSQPVQYGLIAEEVAEVYPGLVAYSADGQIETVKYQLLDSMLLNEVQRQQALIQRLQERLDHLDAALSGNPQVPKPHKP
jgi:hypothetical protein